MPFDIFDIFLVMPPFSESSDVANSGALPGQYATLRTKLYRRARLIAAYGSAGSQSGVTTSYYLGACCCGISTVCCPSNQLPPSATATATTNGVTLPAFHLAAFASVAAATAAYADFGAYYGAGGGSGYFAEIACPTDSNLIFYILIWCPALGGWDIRFQIYNVSLARFDVSWFNGANMTASSIACNPFHWHYEGNNTGAGSAGTYCGFYWDAISVATLILDAVNP